MEIVPDIDRLTLKTACRKDTAIQLHFVIGILSFVFSVMAKDGINTKIMVQIDSLTAVDLPA